MESLEFGRDIPWRANGVPVVDAEDYAKNTLLIPLAISSMQGLALDRLSWNFVKKCDDVTPLWI
jgi:hypothetical protein